MEYCPECGGELELKGFNLGILDPQVTCGANVYYHCSECQTWWKSDQLGIVARRANLEKVPSSLIKSD